MGFGLNYEVPDRNIDMNQWSVYLWMMRVSSKSKLIWKDPQMRLKALPCDVLASGCVLAGLKAGSSRGSGLRSLYSLGLEQAVGDAHHHQVLISWDKFAHGFISKK